MSVVPEQSFVPILVEQIFQKYTEIFETAKNPVVPPFHPRRIDPRLRKFFYELKSILSEEIVQRAVRLLDEQNITIFQLENIGREFAVITEGRRKKRKIHLFPFVNYCSCANFKHFVLGVKDIPVMPNTASTSSSPAILFTINSEKKEHYTCEHVLALRLATIFKSPCLRIEILPKERFNLEIRHMGYLF